jgi:hypothetical protein
MYNLEQIKQDLQNKQFQKYDVTIDYLLQDIESVESMEYDIIQRYNEIKNEQTFEPEQNGEVVIETDNI